MPARFQPQAQIQRPLQNEINALVKLVNGVSLAAFTAHCSATALKWLTTSCSLMFLTGTFGVGSQGSPSPRADTVRVSDLFNSRQASADVYGGLLDLHSQHVPRNEQDLAPAPPRHLLQTLEARCEEFDTICDQIYYILVSAILLVVLEMIYTCSPKTFR